MFQINSIMLLLFLAVPTCISASETATFPTVNGACLPNCSCSHTAMKCNGFIPFAIPEPFQELILSGIDSEEFQPRRFCHLDDSWDTLTALAIISVRAISTGPYNLFSGVFDCLGNVATFQFQSDRLTFFDNLTFTGLSNVTSLDLSGCIMMNWDDLYDTFTVSQNFPKLDSLILSGAGTFGSIIFNLDDTFINALSTRPLEYLDLSYINIGFNFWNSGNICKTLKYLSYAGSNVRFTSLFVISNTCESLRVLDISDTSESKIIFQQNHCVNDYLNLGFLLRFYAAVEIIFLNRIITSSTKFMPSNCTLYLYDGSHITDIHFSQNYLPNFDILLMNDQIKVLNLSKDSITDINPNAFEGLSSLRELDLSFNKLSKMESFEKRFSELFRYNLHIKHVHLNGNELKYVPDETFVSNVYLEHLDLSNNSLTQIDFEVSHLLGMTLLDFRFNRIEALDDASRRSLDALYTNQIKANKTDVVQVLLQGNPLSCHCRRLSFLQWLVNAPIFSTTRHHYKCQLDGQYFIVDTDGVNAAKEDCEQARRKRLKTILLSTLLPLSALMILVISLLLYKQYKKRLLRQQFANGIRRLQENADRFPVFLSYSSDDNDFVRRHMLQQMQVLVTKSETLDFDSWLTSLTNNKNINVR